MPPATLILLLMAAQPPIEQSATAHETVYTLTQGDCRISLETYPTELNRHVVRYRAACPLAFPEQVPLIVRLLQHVRAAEPARFTSLFWGRLLPDFVRDTTLSTRLAQAAGESPNWNRATGRPRKGGINQFARELANGSLIYRELRDALCPLGLDLRVSSMEKVLVSPARLPYDAITWFALTPASPNCPLSTDNRQSP